MILSSISFLLQREILSFKIYWTKYQYVRAIWSKMQYVQFLYFLFLFVMKWVVLQFKIKSFLSHVSFIEQKKSDKKFRLRIIFCFLGYEWIKLFLNQIFIIIMLLLFHYYSHFVENSPIYFGYEIFISSTLTQFFFHLQIIIDQK